MKNSYAPDRKQFRKCLEHHAEVRARASLSA